MMRFWTKPKARAKEGEEDFWKGTNCQGSLNMEVRNTFWELVFRFQLGKWGRETCHYLRLRIQEAEKLQRRVV